MEPVRVYLQLRLMIYTLMGINILLIASLYPIGFTSMNDPLIQFVKQKRRALKMTQHDLANRAGVGLRFIRDLEQGKPSLRLDKVNQVLSLFGHQMAPLAKQKDHESR